MGQRLEWNVFKGEWEGQTWAQQIQTTVLESALQKGRKKMGQWLVGEVGSDKVCLLFH